MLDLGLFSGRLYFDDDEHVPLCQLLGLSTSTAKEENTPVTDGNSESAAVAQGLPMLASTVAARLTENDNPAMPICHLLEPSSTADAKPDSDADIALFDKPRADSPVDLRTTAAIPTMEDTAKPLLPFSPHPLLFMQELLTLRRKGQDISQSPMGFLCRGRKLELGGEADVPVVSSTSEDEIGTDLETGAETGAEIVAETGEEMEDEMEDEISAETGKETGAKVHPSTLDT